MLREADLSGVVLWEKVCHYRAHPDELFRLAAKAKELGRPEAAAAIVDDMVTGVIRSHRPEP
jgi:hypothetical protein